jgi:serine/threonine protein phosphatase 1
MAAAVPCRGPDPAYTGVGQQPQRERFALLPAGGRIWAVAAIHGEAVRLGRLHAQLRRVLTEQDRLVYLGNYLGHTADVVETLDEMLVFRLWFLARSGARLCHLAHLRGAQEEMWQKLLQLQFATNPREVLAWMRGQGIDATIRAYAGRPEQGQAAARDGAVSIGRWTVALREAVRRHAGHDQLLNGLKRAALTEDQRCLFVHAGLDVNRPLHAQSDSFWWGSGTFAQPDQPYGTFVRVVRGYDRHHPGIVETAHHATVDAGAGFGGTLAAAAFDSAGRLVDRLEV